MENSTTKIVDIVNRARSVLAKAVHWCSWICSSWSAGLNKSATYIQCRTKPMLKIILKLIICQKVLSNNGFNSTVFVFFFPFRFFFRGYLKKYIKANSCIHSSKIIIMAYFYTFAITSFWSIFVISLKKCSQNCNRKMIGNWKYISGDINI